MSCVVPRIAPLVTTITSTPEACSPATSSHTRAIGERRSAPASSATTDDPSFTTATAKEHTLGESAKRFSKRFRRCRRSRPARIA